MEVLCGPPWSIGNTPKLILSIRSFFAKDHTSAGTSKAFVGCCGYHIAVFERVAHKARRNESTDVSDVCHQVSTDRISNHPESLIIEISGVSWSPTNQNLGFVQENILFQLIIIDKTGLSIHEVWLRLEKLAGSRNFLVIRLMTVREMSTMRKRKTHYFVIRLQQTCIHSQIGWRSREWLHIYSPLILLQAESF